MNPKEEPPEIPPSIATPTKIEESVTQSQATQPIDTSRRIGAGMIALLWVLVLGGGVWLAQGWLDGRAQRNAPVWTSDSNGSGALTLSADRYGQYWITGSANDHTVNFLLDTGATDVSLPQSVADRLGLKRGQASRAITANGTVTIYATNLDSLSIGPLTRNRVRAHINPSMEGDVALLGMNFLRHFELLQRAGELTIRLP